VNTTTSSACLQETIVNQSLTIFIVNQSLTIFVVNQSLVKNKKLSVFFFFVLFWFVLLLLSIYVFWSFGVAGVFFFFL